jgi:RHS repeat-associated protein
MRLCRIAYLLCIACPLSMPALAQDDPNFETGLKQFGSYNGGNIDTTNLMNGNLSLDIPLISYPQRGGKLRLDFSLHYVNLGTYADNPCVSFGSSCLSGPNFQHGFYIMEKGMPEPTGPPMSTEECPEGGGTCIVLDSESIELSDGSIHTMGPTSASTWKTVDGSAIRLDIAGTSSNPSYPIKDSNGLQYTGPTSGSVPPNGHAFNAYVPVEELPSLRQDTNGNQISYSPWSGYVDTLGRTIPVPPVPIPTPIMSLTVNGSTTVYSTSCPGLTGTGSSSGDGITETYTYCELGATQNFSGCSGPLAISLATIWNAPTPNGGTSPIKFCFVEISETLPYTPSCIVSPCNPQTYNTSALQSVVLPNGTTWTFQYTSDGNADLADVTFPTGGTLSYTWTSASPGPSLHLVNYPRTVVTRTLNPNDGVDPSGTWTYSYSNNWSACSSNVLQCTTTTQATDPSGNASVHTFTNFGYFSYFETQAQHFQGSSTSGTLLKTVNTSYSSFVGPTIGFSGETQWTWSTAFPTTITTIWANGQESQVQHAYDSSLVLYNPTFTTSGSFYISSTTYAEPYGKELTRSEYDYGSGAPGSLLRTTTTSYLALNNSSYLAANLLNLPSSVSVIGSGPGSTTTYSYDENNGSSQGTLGNLTSTHRWLNTTSSYLVTTNIYNSNGLVTSTTDPKGNTTTYAYGSCYAGSGPTAITNALSQTTSYCYDSNTGLLTSTTDPNNQATTYAYDDMLRTTQIKYPDGGQIGFSYPTANDVDITEAITSSSNRLSYLVVDGVGRQIRQAVTNGGSSLPYDEADTCYDALGRVSFKSYPFQDSGPFATSRSCGSPEAGNSFAYDALNRATSITHSDGSSVLTSYTGRATSVQDEGNGTQRVQRISQVDGLGRLTSVCEVTSTTLSIGISGSTSPAACGQDISATGFLTTYAYDALDDLTSVSQGPLNPRSFVYDSLARLTSSTNPESGTTTYTYDNDGNVATKVNARGITTSYTYDGLNRITLKTYSDGTTPAAEYFYDSGTGTKFTPTNPVGRLTHEGTYLNGTWFTASVYYYDPMGRVTFNAQCTQAQATWCEWQPTYTYDLLGDVTTTTNGVGVTLTNSYNVGARLTTVASSGLSGSNFPSPLLSNAQYNAAGSPTSASLGNGVCESRSYDGRLRLTGITDHSSCTGSSLYTLAISSSGDSDIVAANDSVNGNWTYSYDAFNRLASSSQSSGAAYSYAYDRFGNRWSQTVTAGTGVSSSLGFNANNRIASGVTYDAAGDTTNDGTTTYTYDGEGRVTTAANNQSGTSTYVYDAEGRRIQKTTAAGGTVDFVYDLAGHEIAQINSSGTWTRLEVYAGDRHIGTYSGGTSGATYFIHGDWLGTERGRSTVAGALCETITSLPFGDGMTISSSCGDPSPMHFTGKEHDNESGLDNYGARYSSSSMGRFMSPDYQVDDEPPDALPNAAMPYPQTLNLYSYVQNNSISKTDPDGHASFQPCSDNPSVQCWQGDYRGERDCGTGTCLFWNGSEWVKNDPGAPPSSDLAGWWFTGFARLASGDPYGLKQMGYAYAKLALLPFGGWNLLKPPGTSGSRGNSQAGGRPAIVPDHWIEKPTRKGNGKIYIDPDNPHNRVRVMDDGYMKVQKNGQTLDMNGNPVPPNSPDAHISVDTPMNSPFLDAPGLEVPIIE